MVPLPVKVNLVMLVVGVWVFLLGEGGTGGDGCRGHGQGWARNNQLSERARFGKPGSVPAFLLAHLPLFLFPYRESFEEALGQA